MASTKNRNQRWQSRYIEDPRGWGFMGEVHRPYVTANFRVSSVVRACQDSFIHVLLYVVDCNPPSVNTCSRLSSDCEGETTFEK